jgi:hypothetical protein
MEVLIHPSNRSVFGIHCLIFDRDARSVFSFLLNSHHKLFADAKMSVPEPSPESRATLVTQATRIGVIALAQQIEAATDHGPEPERTQP